MDSKIEDSNPPDEDAGLFDIHDSVELIDFDRIS